MDTVTDKRCDLTELLVTSCAHCKGLPDVAPDDDPNADIFADPAPVRRRAGAWITARFPGECSGCGRDIDEGESIRSDGEGGWEGTCCA